MYFLISDFDYTLYTHDDKEMISNNLYAVQRWRAHGNIFVIATGRGPTALAHTMPNYRDYADYLVFDDGAIVRDNHDSPLLVQKIPTSAINKIEQLLPKFPFEDEYAFVCYYGDKEYPDFKETSSKIRLWLKSSNDCKAITEAITNECGNKVRCQVYCDLKENFDAARLPWVKHNMSHMIDILHKGTDKAVGVDAILNRYRHPYISHNKIFVIGDDMNDLGMIEAFNGYAVPNSSAKLLERIPSSRIVSSLSHLIDSLLQRTPV